MLRLYKTAAYVAQQMWFFPLVLTASRPGIAFSVGLCARFQSNPKESHHIVVKRILRYLKETNDLSLFYPKSDVYDLKGYTDADYA